MMHDRIFVEVPQHIRNVDLTHYFYMTKWRKLVDSYMGKLLIKISKYKLLGNVVILKNFLRTRKIMVMHSKERGECDLHTLVDRQRKR